MHALAATQQNIDNELIIRALVLELAKDLEEPEDILEQFGISRDEYEALAQTRIFKTMLQQARKEWEGANNTHERVKFKSATLIEKVLPEMYKELTNDKHPLSSRADLFGRIAKLGNLGNSTERGNNGETFSLTINLGGDKNVTIARVLPPKVIEGEWEDL